MTHHPPLPSHFPYTTLFRSVPVGGAAYLASAVRRLRAANPNSVVVAAGDLIGASPLVSAEFLDEPSVLALNLIGLDLDRKRTRLDSSHTVISYGVFIL